VVEEVLEPPAGTIVDYSRAKVEVK